MIEKYDNMYVSIYNGTSVMYDNNFNKFLKFLQEKFNEIPKQYQHTAEIVFNSDYEDIDVFMEIIYYRPETDEEYQKRLEKYEKRFNYIEAMEYKQYLKLKEKFEGVNESNIH